MRSSGRQVGRGCAAIAGEEKPAGLFPCVPPVAAQEDAGRRRPVRVQVCLRVSREGGGSGERTAKGLIVCSYVCLQCALVAFACHCLVFVDFIGWFKPSCWGNIVVSGFRGQFGFDHVLLLWLSCAALGLRAACARLLVCVRVSIFCVRKVRVTMGVVNNSGKTLPNCDAGFGCGVVCRLFKVASTLGTHIVPGIQDSNAVVRRGDHVYDRLDIFPAGVPEKGSLLLVLHLRRPRRWHIGLAGALLKPFIFLQSAVFIRQELSCYPHSTNG